MRAPKREHLLNTAETLFAKEGFKGVSVSQLLDEAGVAKMTLYKGFESKEELIRETLRRRASRLHSLLAEFTEKEGLNPQERLLACFDGAKSIASRQDFNGCYFINALAEFGNEDGAEAEIARHHKENIIKLLRDLCEECDVPDALELAKTMHLLIEGATTAHMALNDLGNFDRAKHIAQALLADAMRKN
ncbi:TetR/AcrR family transcriptional regulator [Cognatishimia activa]|uniref:TetR/AcrR family transcriptional regulator n=1 Tax=Cognatishimia activa TaxID=1715691 RepID=UPI002231D232|nr:TetR family transcriptional regulator [Cognatishimia activa]UZD91471.1 TetR family transcriptional regulator [Cognatishimia activa]